MASTRKGKSKPSKEGKKKKIRERTLYLIPKERRTSKRRVMRLAKKSSSSLRAIDEVSVIGGEPTNLANTAVTIATPRVARPFQRGIMIRELVPQQEQTQIEILERKGKKKVKRAPAALSRDSTPSLISRARREVEENKLREEAWLQGQRNRAIGVEASKPRSSSIFQEVEQHFMVIEQANPPSKMKKVIMPFLQ